MITILVKLGQPITNVMKQL